MNHAIDVNIKTTSLNMGCIQSPDYIVVEATFKDRQSAGFHVNTDMHLTAGGDRDCSEQISPMETTYNADGRLMRSAPEYRKMPKITLHELIEHFLVLVHRPRIQYLSFKNCMLDLNSISEIFKGFPIGILNISAERYDSNENTFYSQILHNFADQTEQFAIEYGGIFHNRQQIHELLARDLHCVVFTKMAPSSLQIVNATRIVLDFQVEPQFLNEFIKLWQRGSNPRMKYFQARVDVKNEQCGSQILNGVETFSFEEYGRRAKGKTARIFLRKNGLFKMYVGV